MVLEKRMTLGFSRRSAARLFLTVAFGLAGAAYAQSTTSGDVSGTLTDPSGAVIPNATIKVTNIATGESKTATTTANGSFRVSLLSPGNYKVTATAPGFSSVVNTVDVAAGTVTNDDLKVAVGQSGTTVEVTAAPEIVNTENADISTVFTSEQVQALPNPGNDLTFVAQTAPGSVMNTGTAAGGYGNFSSFGISGLSNMFTLDGGYENDPFLNLNNTGASNLTLGNNEVDTVTVVAPAFSAQFGGLGGAQVNEITTSGSNRIHGNANYYWDGRALNANDWFNKQNQVFNGEPNLPVFVNANQWSASIGGPILKDRLFWFVNTEGIRATTPVTGQVYVPSALYENCALGKDPGNATYASCATLNAAADANTANNPSSTQVGLAGDGIAFAAAPASQQQFLTTVFNTYNNSPFRPSGSAVQADPNDVTANTYYAQNRALLTEWLLTARLDFKISDRDNFYVHYKQDHGTQPTYTDLIDPRFTAASQQPAWEGQMNETHTFTPNFTNQLVVTGNYYSAPFQNSNNFSPVAPSTILFITGDLGNTAYGGEDYAFPQGRRVSGYQVIDDVTYNKGRNTVRFGYNIRRDNVSDLQGVETVAPIDEGTVEAFANGAYDYEHIQRFPVKLEQPVSVYDMGAYVEDTFRFRPNLTVTAGLRMERNSNPVCHTNCFQVLNYPASALPTGTNIPYNAASPGGYISAGRHRALTGFQEYAPMPRVSFNFQPSPKTVIRGGFGMFTDSFPGVVADDLLSNAPTNFHAAVLGTSAGGANNLPVTPSTAGSGPLVAAASAAAFQTAFATGGTYATTGVAVANAGGLYSAPNFTTAAKNISYPTYEEFSMAIEQRLDNKSSVAVTYVGNHGYHEPVVDGTRNLSNPNAGKPTFGFAGIPTTRPIRSFNSITNIYSGASSNYNGVVLSATRRSKGLTVQFNYQFSKALDEISNGGFEPFAPDAGDSGAVANPFNLHAQYGLADYNVKHNTTGTFVYEVPSFSRRFKDLTGGFEFSGVAFHQSGLPYTVGYSTTSIDYINPGTGKAGSSNFANGTVQLYARQLDNNFDHHCGGGAHALLPNGTAPAPCNFTGHFAQPTGFTQQNRNTLIGPSYTNVDLGAFKTFHIPHYDAGRIKLGIQSFNLFNHPNFQNPGHTDAFSTSSSFGAISSTVGAPTSILGSVGGSDASPRLLQLHANLTF